MDGVSSSPREDGRPARLSANRLTALGRALGPLDREALQFLAKFTVATTDQSRRVLCADRVSRHAGELAVWRLLRRLEHDRLIARLPRRVGGITGGSTPDLWHLTAGGRRLLATIGNSPRAARLRGSDPPALSTLNHRLALAEAYARLCELRTGGALDMLELDAEPACWRRFANAGGGTAILKPDAHLLSAARGSAYERLWFLEIDMGSESPATIRRKAEVYEAYRRTGIEQSRNGAFPMVAWIAPDERRAKRLGRLFAANGLEGLHEAMTLDAFVAQTVQDEGG
jgi:hypothetical protein